MALKIETPSVTYFIRKRHGAPTYEAILRNTESGDFSTVEWDADELINLVTGVTPDKTTRIPEQDVPIAR